MDYYKQYADFLRRQLKIKKLISVVFDCSNGTTGLVLKKLLGKREKVKVESIVVNGKPDGNFPAHGPDPWKGGAIPALGKEVVRRGADCGAIFDADGDRVFFTDDRGQLVSPDHAAILMAQNFAGPVILDVRHGFLVREWLTAHKRKIVDSRVGHFFIKKLMRQKKIAFAAELSGHYYFSAKSARLLASLTLRRIGPDGQGSPPEADGPRAYAFGGKDIYYFDSGIFAAIQFLNSVSHLPLQTPHLSTWIDAQPKYYQSGELNFTVKDKKTIMEKMYRAYKSKARRVSRLDGIKMEFGTGDGTYWVSIRPSNTEDLLRLNVEAKEERVLKEKLREIRQSIR